MENASRFVTAPFNAGIAAITGLPEVRLRLIDVILVLVLLNFYTVHAIVLIVYLYGVWCLRTAHHE